MVLTCLVYFAVGLVRDALCAIYYRAISVGQARLAGGVGGGITLLDLGVLGLLIRAWSVPLLIAYSLGSGLGTFFIVRKYK